MSFSGKKYRRKACENIEELCHATNATEQIKRLLQAGAPTFSFTRVDERNFTFNLELGDRHLTTTFRLDEEHEMERRDGSKIKVTYSLEADNVLKQVIKQPDGKIAYFRREFGDNDAKMTITMEGTPVKANIFYEVIS